MTIKLVELINLYNAFASLDGYSKSVKGKDGESVSIVPYSFSGKLRWNISKNLGVLKPHIKDYTKVRDDLIKQFALPGETTIEAKTNPDGWAKFDAENTKLGDQDIEISLLKLNVDELLKDENPVPSSILDALAAHLTEPTA